MLDTHQSIRSVIDLKSQCVFNLIELHTPSNTNNIFPSKSLTAAVILSNKPPLAIFSQKIARTNETLSLIGFMSLPTRFRNKALTLEPAILSKKSYLER